MGGLPTHEPTLDPIKCMPLLWTQNLLGKPKGSPLSSLRTKNSLSSLFIVYISQLSSLVLQLQQYRDFLGKKMQGKSHSSNPPPLFFISQSNSLRENNNRQSKHESKVVDKERDFVSQEVMTLLVRRLRLDLEW